MPFTPFIVIISRSSGDGNPNLAVLSYLLRDGIGQIREPSGVRQEKEYNHRSAGIAAYLRRDTMAVVVYESKRDEATEIIAAVEKNFGVEEKITTD
jgi:hypothetical protein